jgi:hypothetical protein
MRDWWRSRICVGVCCLVLAVFFVLGSSGAEISNTASFLALGLGARSLALGGAFVAVADGIDSLTHNPAGLFSVEGIGVSSSYETRIETFEYGHVSAVSRGIGFSISYFDFGAIPETDSEGNSLGFFSYQDVALLLGATVARGHARTVGDWSIGFGAKLVRMGQQFSDNAGRGGAVDIGFLVGRNDTSLPWLLSGFGFGVLLENVMTSGIAWGLEGHTESWPFDAVLGVSLEFAELILLAFESDIAEGIRLGIECTPIPQLALRGGLKHEGTPMWSLGLGLNLPRFSLDYAVVFHRYLAEEHRLTFSVYLR